MLDASPTGLAVRSRGLLRRFARLQAMLGVPLIVILFVLHLGLSSTSQMLIQAQFNFYQANATLQKGALAMVQARRAMEVSAARRDPVLMRHAGDVLESSLAQLEEVAWNPPGGRLPTLSPQGLAPQLADIRTSLQLVDAAATALQARKPLPDLTPTSDRLDVLYITFREMQARHEQQVLEVYTRLATQQQRYEWAVRGTLLVLLLMYGALVWLYLNQRRVLNELAEAHAAAERATRAKSDFLAVMSHEIRTPLNGVIGVTDLLDNTDCNPQQREYLRVIRDSGAHLLRIIDDVLDFSRIEADHSPLQEAPFDLRQVVSQVTALMTPQARPEVALSVDVSNHVPARLVGDRTRYSQVLTNLLDNALKFTHEGEVMLDIDVTDREELVIRVRDTGIGMEPQTLDRLYQPFQQADSSIERRYGGTGLGLAITRRLVESMGGDIEARSVPGQGTEFVVHLPLARAEATSDDDPATAPRRGRSGLAVLVVEDNPVNQMVTRRMLESLGHRVEMAGDGHEGTELACARNARHDLVLMDLQMPRMSGIDATREMRARGCTTPVVALSANALPEHRAAAAEAGMCGFIVKPARLADIEKLLAELFPADA